VSIAVRLLAAEAPEGPWSEVGSYELPDYNPLIYYEFLPEVIRFPKALNARHLRLEVNSVHPYGSLGPAYAVAGEVVARVSPPQSPPIISASGITLTSIEVNGSSLVVRFESEEGVHYRVLRSGLLNDWGLLDEYTDFVGTGSGMAVDLPLGTVEGEPDFFRLEKIPSEP